MSVVGMPSTGEHREAVVSRADSAPLPSVATSVGEPRRGFGCADWTDRELICASPDVRELAFAELFRRHASSVAAAAKMLLGGSSPASDDVVAEVFAALWVAPEKFDPDRGSVLGFLRLGARGRSIDLLRSESSRHRRERNDRAHERLVADVEAQLLSTEALEGLRRAVARLPEIERTPIELAYFADMTNRAVAVQLGLPEGTVKSRIRRGLATLRVEIESPDCRAVDELSVATLDSILRLHAHGLT